MDLEGSSAIDDALGRVGQLLAARGASYAIIVLGGAALNLLGIVDRATTDVDILAFADPPKAKRQGKAPEPPKHIHAPPEPLPSALTDAVVTVARDLGPVRGLVEHRPRVAVARWTATRARASRTLAPVFRTVGGARRSI